MSAIASLALLIFINGVAIAGQLETAMDVELRRAMTELQAEGYPRPYYLSLSATDVDLWDARCTMGAERAGGGFAQRLITPDLRVGSRELDNHPVSPWSGFVGRSVSLEDDEFALRHSLWRMLDSSYKQASADFLRKQAIRVRRGKTEYDTDDMTAELPRVKRQAQPAPAWDKELLRRLCKAGSAEFRAQPGLLHVDAGVKLQRHWTMFRDSEGSKVDFGRDVAELELEAVDISTDGLRLYASRRFLIPGGRPLPTADEIRAAARGMLRDLDELKLARSTSPMSAPALLDPSVAAAVVLAIGTRLTGEEERNPGGAQIFRDKMGKNVLPPEFTLVDDPTAPGLAGSYDFDSQGMPAQRVTLIEDGRLRALLLSRYPVIGFSKSNGHARSTPGTLANAAPGSLFLTTKNPLAAAELLARLREETKKRGKTHGIWVRQLRAWSQQQGAGGQGSVRLMGLVYLVEAKTGKLTLVRDVDMVGTPLALMGNILSAGSDLRPHDMTSGVPVSVTTPSLLLYDVELQRAETKPEKSPILPPPPATPLP